MGAYAYLVTRTGHINVNINGKFEKVYLAKYQAKARWLYDVWNEDKSIRLAEARIEKVRQAWEDNEEKPQFVCFSDSRPKEGAEIYMWNDAGILYYDSDGGIEKIGAITKVGNRWHLKPLEKEQPNAS